MLPELPTARFRHRRIPAAAEALRPQVRDFLAQALHGRTPLQRSAS